MQYTLEGKTEHCRINFDKTSVQSYCQLIELPESMEVPVSYIAKIWPTFILFQSFIGVEVRLRETEVRQYHKIKCYEDYDASLTCQHIQVIKNFRQYTFQLTIQQDENIALEIRQKFVEVMA